MFSEKFWQFGPFFCLQVISLGDTIKFSLSPSKSNDRLSTNVSGVPLDERNLVRHEQTLLYLLILFFLLFIPLPCGFYVDHFCFCRLLRPLIFTGKKLALITFFGWGASQINLYEFVWLSVLGCENSDRRIYGNTFAICWQIHLDKKVPTGAGLGGGSSNAATALWAANQFSGGLATEKELLEWSSEIGSDISFFFSHGAAYCTGRGEVSS